MTSGTGLGGSGTPIVEEKSKPVPIGNSNHLSPAKYRKRSSRNSYDRGYRTLDVICFCGKLLKSWEAFRDHFQMKHPKVLRRMKQSGLWDQERIDWGQAP